MNIYVCVSGLFIPALALISLSFIESTNKEAVIVILVIVVGFNAGHYSGFNINHIDLAPAYAGVLMGISNSVSAIFTICAPLAVDLVKSITGYTEVIIKTHLNGFICAYKLSNCIFLFTFN